MRDPRRWGITFWRSFAFFYVNTTEYFPIISMFLKKWKILFLSAMLLFQYLDK